MTKASAFRGMKPWGDVRALALTVLMLTGCGYERTYSHAEAEKMRAEVAAQPSEDDAYGSKGPRRAHGPPPDIIESPGYSVPLPVVFDATVRACESYYHDLKAIDREHWRVLIEVRNAWSGSSDVTVQLTEAAGTVTVSVESKGLSGDNNTGRCRRDVREIVSRLATQMDPAFRSGPPPVTPAAAP